MLIFNSLEEMKPYYNENTDTYEFIENGKSIDVQFDFSINIEANIKARDIKAGDIKARDISAGNIIAGNIIAVDINAWDIIFYAVCFAYQTFKCKTIKGKRENSKYFCLDNEIEFIKE